MISKQYILAGEAVFTIEVPEAYRGTSFKPHYTFEVWMAPASMNWPAAWFLKLLTGPNNRTDFSYLGRLDKDSGKVLLTAKSKLPADSPVLKLLGKVLARIWADEGAVIEATGFKVHHEGCCGKCGQRLTTPESVERGIGPECWEMLTGERAARVANRAAAKRRREARAAEPERVGVNAGQASREQHERMLDV